MTVQYLRTDQEAQLASDRERLTKQLSNPLVQDKGNVHRELRKVERTLEMQRAPELVGAELDAAVREAKDLEQEIAPNMLSGEEMRKSPPGSVGRELAFQKRFKGKILRWKNLMRSIHRGSEDPDVANFERFRPHTRSGDPSMAGAAIPGKSFSLPSDQFQENYEKVKWEKPTASTQSKKKKRRPMSAEQKERMRQIALAGWEQRKAAKAAAERPSA